MARPLVVVSDFINPPLTHEERILGDIADIVALNAFSEEDLVGRIEEADAIMLYHFISITRKTIERLKKCKLIVRCGVGYDNVDRAYARERGINVANVPDYGSEEVADSAIGMMLTLMRGVHYLNSRCQHDQGPWIYEQVRPIQRLRGLTFGVVGIGRIGTATALRAKAFGFQVVFYDPYVVDGTDKALGVRRCETLEELLRQSDVVSVHTPRTAETQHILNDKTIAQMKPGSYLVNTARGGCVDAHAVLRAVEANHLRGAGLDVLEIEPPPADDPLIRAWRDPSHPAHDRIIINPHSAFYSEQGLDDMRIKGSENCRRVLLGQPPRNVVN
ncbi:C-terminal binding protein [Planctomyces sp. SH-PL14]|uniref:C-terminal binding protein n=1 Tax=Planctomyces sp. SH-PL14 TaxID=1632864 RepID=UPI00078DB477|nr:C-terminal binding protein [Planctomyces sp. SH-PL14]AMV21372.1 Putative 2-hydroxyacid dehydrogenase [Planctomyces sp. SH-PL14]